MGRTYKERKTGEYVKTERPLVRLERQRPEQVKKRVAAYCRVSTHLEEQQGSLEIQMESFRERIRKHMDWELVGIYADEGVSGTQAAKREEFRRLIRDCEAGKIDYIITKSVSRFARNTLECIGCVRRLKELGVYVLFEKENIDSGNAASTLVLNFMSAVAEEESRNISENVKWSFRKKFEEGLPKWVQTYGFQKAGPWDYRADPAEAPVVRRIFRQYAEGASMARIIRDLEAEGIAPPKGSRWHPKTVAGILSNEKYRGDVRMQKTYVKDFLTHQKVVNDGTVKEYYLMEDHEPLVDEEIFRLAQIVRSLKDRHKGIPQYPYHGFLTCPFCGEKMIRGVSREHGRPGVWYCSGEGEAFYVYEAMLDEAFCTAYGQAGVKSFTAKQSEKSGKIDLPSTVERVEYYILDVLVQNITFEDEGVLCIAWKNGKCTRQKMRCTRERELPGSAAQREYFEKMLPRPDAVSVQGDELRHIYGRECFYGSKVFGKEQGFTEEKALMEEKILMKAMETRAQ